MRHRTIRAIPVLLSGLIAACGSDDNHDGHSTLCEHETRADIYVAGIEKTTDAAQFTIRLLEATPTPPDRGDNTWTLQLLDAAKMPTTATASVSVEMVMPDHGHGTNPRVHQAVPAGSEGKYRLGPFDLFMAGLWEFTVTATSGGQMDQTKFAFCLEG